MVRAKFISTEYLKKNTTIEENVDNDKLVPFIYKVQDIYLQQSLGTTFYDHLQNAIANDTLTTDEENLIRQYIQPMVAEYVVYEAMPHLNFKLTNKAVSQESSEFSTPSILDDIKYLRATVRDMAEFYNQRLVKYLCDFSLLFPKYENPDDKENLRRSRKAYFSGIYIPKKHRCNCGFDDYPGDGSGCSCC